jgi:ribosomal 50S subunit-recycling heat shock protein
MTNFRESHLDTTLSVGMIAAGLAIAWFGNVDSVSQAAARIAAEDRVTVSQEDSRFKVTVTAQRPHDFVPARDTQRLTERPATQRT